MKEILRKIRRLFDRIERNPFDLITIALALLKGSWYIFRYSFFNKKIKIAFPFFVFGPVTLKGPGFISIENSCSVYLNVFQGLTIVTLNDQARVFIGKKTRMGGLSIRCSQEIRIGSDCMTSVSFVQDSIMVNRPNEKSSLNAALLDPAPISIGHNCWLGGQSGVLKGSKIGNDCVISAGALTYNCEIGNYRLGIGNPCAMSFPIDNLLAMEKKA